MAKCLKIAKSENFSFSYKYRKNTPNISKEIFLKRNCSVSIWIFEKKQIFLFYKNFPLKIPLKFI